MFNVTRTYPAPNSIAKGKYNEEDVLTALKPMFLEKCYLCERDDIQDAEVEHFVPHQNDETLKYDWDNLYYSCSRCNSIKSNTHVNLLDCTNHMLDIGELISCMMPPAPSEKVIIRATSRNPTVQTNNTVELLDKCYNLENTALRGISRESLMEQMWEHYTDLLIARQTLRKKKSAAMDKQRAEQVIAAMLDIQHPFSIFWRYYYLNDSFLMEKHPELRVGF
ncbi:HNH endonuclease [Photobacterium leiognathi]|uniref:HNH endonuclease n=1 Tax=Photobacterium leiognathi TaxID=553611 RepID=UPI002981662D|nr:HNH endonuclease [Photobacterium leiognathi]